MKLIVISTSNFERRIDVLFQLTKLAEDHQVEYWDVSAVTTKETFRISFSNGKIKIVTVESNQQFDDLVRINTNDATFITYFNYFEKTYKCYRILSKHNAKIIYCVNGCMPSLPISKRFKASRIPCAIKNRLVLLLKKTSLIKPARMVLLTCAKAIEGDIYKTSTETEFIPYNSGDYQSCLDMEQTKPLTQSKYLVFIDQNLPFHPDIKLVGQGDGVDADSYFSAINNFFKKVECKYSCKVVIAAHPSANRYLDHNYFEGREVFFNKTGALVKDSIGVITHVSTALSFPVVYKKPVIIFMTDSIREALSGVFYVGIRMGRLIKALIFESEKDINLPASLQIDEKAYNEYKYNYLTNHESETISNYDILLNILKNG